MTPRKVSAKTAKERAWKACSQYIRRKYADSNGMCKCVTCGSLNPIAETDAGHFIPKARGKAIYFVEENIHPQCPGCNRFSVEYSKISYVRFMEETYGPEKIDELMAECRKIVRFRVSDYLEIEAHYKERLKELAA